MNADTSALQAEKLMLVDHSCNIRHNYIVEFYTAGWALTVQASHESDDLYWIHFSALFSQPSGYILFPSYYSNKFLMTFIGFVYALDFMDLLHFGFI